MHTKQNIHKLLLAILLFIALDSNAQKVKTYKINQLTHRIFNDSDTTYVVNFWATWCKPLLFCLLILD